MEEKLKGFLDQFFALEIVPGKRVRIPYWRNRFLTGGLRRIQGPFGGKGTPNQIRRVTLKKAKEAGLKLERMSETEISRFMKQKRIGLDCSGFAFQILNFLYPGFWQGLKMAPGRSKNPIRRFNAEALTSKENTRQVRSLRRIMVGDLIPLIVKGDSRVDHIMVIVDIAKEEIIYAHSSSTTPISGPHLGRIRIVDWGRGLEDQEWLEKKRSGESLGEFFAAALGVRRIKTV